MLMVSLNPTQLPLSHPHNSLCSVLLSPLSTPQSWVHSMKASTPIHGKSPPSPTEDNNSSWLKPMKLTDSLSPKSPPIGSGPRGEVHLPPSMHSYEKNHGEEAGETSSAVGEPTLNLFPLTPDLKRKSTASLTDDGTLIVEKKAKKVISGCDTEEDGRNGVSTELVLLFDPYKIKKKLPKSDLGNLSRLLIPQPGVESHLFPCMSEELVKRVKTKEGAEVVVWDADTRSEHRLVFAYWETSHSYVLKGGWNKKFVRRRGLANGDEIGIYWDPIAIKFLFSLLRKPN